MKASGVLGASTGDESEPMRVRGVVGAYIDSAADGFLRCPLALSPAVAIAVYRSRRACDPDPCIQPASERERLARSIETRARGEEETLNGDRAIQASNVCLAKALEGADE